VQPIGSLIAGGIAKHIGAPYTLALFGVVCLAGSVFFFVRVVMRLDRRQQATTVAQAD
jgi:hypothetical protein